MERGHGTRKPESYFEGSCPLPILMDQLPAVKQEATKPDVHRRYALCIDGTKFFLSAKERLICEVFVRTNGNVSECARIANKEFRRNHSSSTIRKWIDRRRLITRYMEEMADKKAEIEGFTPDEWKLMGIQALKGKRSMNAIQRQIWADYGKLEVHREGADGNSRQQTNIQINFGEKE